MTEPDDRRRGQDDPEQPQGTPAHLGLGLGAYENRGYEGSNERPREVVLERRSAGIPTPKAYGADEHRLECHIHQREEESGDERPPASADVPAGEGGCAGQDEPCERQREGKQPAAG